MQMLVAGSFNLLKFVSNLPSLQAKVKQEEPPSGSTTLYTGGAEPLDETCAGASLPGNTTLQHGEHKVVGELFGSKLGWDEKLTGDTLTKWIKLVDQLRSGPPLTLPRSFLSGPMNGLVCTD